MGIRFERNKCGIYDSINCRFVEPAYLLLDKQKVTQYLKEHPFPKDPAYSEESLLGDLQTTGSWTLPNDIRDETGEYIAEMIHTIL